MYLRGLPFTWVFFTQSSYGILVTYKIFLFIGILLVSGIHDFFFGGKALEEMQKTDNSQLKLMARWSGRISLLFSLAMAFIGLVLSRGGTL